MEVDVRTLVVVPAEVGRSFGIGGEGKDTGGLEVDVWDCAE